VRRVLSGAVSLPRIRDISALRFSRVKRSIPPLYGMVDDTPGGIEEQPMPGQSSRVCYPHFMSATLETVLVSVWQQSLIDKKKTVDLDGETYSVRQTSKSKLRQIDFRFENRDLRGLEQNPNTKSRWAKLARDGKQVMQFLEHGRYIAVVVDGKAHIYKQV
jgi:hypothetical protein